MNVFSCVMTWGAGNGEGERGGRWGGRKLNSSAARGISGRAPLRHHVLRVDGVDRRGCIHVGRGRRERLDRNRLCPRRTFPKPGEMINRKFI